MLETGAKPRQTSAADGGGRGTGEHGDATGGANATDDEPGAGDKRHLLLRENEYTDTGNGDVEPNETDTPRKKGRRSKGGGKQKKPGHQRP